MEGKIVLAVVLNWGLEMGQYIDIWLNRDTLRQQYSINTNSSQIDISNIMIY